MAIAAIVLATAVVHEREQRYDSGIRSCLLRERQTVQPDARPMRRAMNALPIEDESTS